MTRFAGTKSGDLLRNQQLWLARKGGGKFIDAANRANLLDARLIVCVNAFTDTPQSTGQFAAYAKANGIPVAVWELANEAYNYARFFQSGADYVARMKPYRDAIKAVDPNAIVAIFFDDAGNTNSKSAWDGSIAAYPDKYWDAVTYHHYPVQSQGGFSQWMADENGALATKTNARITDYLAPLNPPGTRFLVSEFDPSIGSALPPVSLTDGTLYGGIYVAEYTMRMSTVPSVLAVGSHALTATGGVELSNPHYAELEQAARAGNIIDTLMLDFGFYVSAQANGAGIINGVLKHATESDKTTVIGGVAVAATGPGRIPALHAQAYTNVTGRLSVVVTNKSATAHQVTIRVNGSAPAGPFPIQFITGTDASATNSAENPNAVTLQTDTSSNPVTVPPYSVLRADIIDPAVVRFVNAASYKVGPFAAQQLVTAQGSGFADETIGAQTQPLTTMLGDTTIELTDSAGKVWMAPLYSVGSTQATIVLPEGMASGMASAKVLRSGAAVLTGSLNVALVSPGIFTANQNGAGVAAAIAWQVGPDGTTMLPVFSCQPDIALSCLSTPLPLGAPTGTQANNTFYVSLFGTGIRAGKSVQAYVAGQAVPVLMSGPQQQYDGLDQVDVALPRTLAGSGEASVYLVVDSRMSNMVSVNIQ